MKQFLSVILAVVLVSAVGGSLVSGTAARFFDTEVSTENEMCAGTRSLELSGGPIIVKCGVPSKWYSQEYLLINTGTLEGLATVHILEESLKCVEAGAKHGEVWNGSAYVTGTPVGNGVASSEPELVAEEGGQVGQITVAGLGWDSGADTGPPDWVMSKHVDIKIWFDKNGDDDFDDEGELIVYDKLFDVACHSYELGVIPAAGVQLGTKRSGWGSCFNYTIGSPTLKTALMAGQNIHVGTVSVWTDGGYLWVKFDTTISNWEMDETHVYVDADPPLKMAPGKFPYKHDPVSQSTEDLYQIPLSWNAGEKVCIAAHAAGTDDETAWSNGTSRKMKLELHLQQVEDPAWVAGGVDYDQDGDIDEDDAQKRFWPTNAFQGDNCTFDMELKFEQDNSNPKWWRQ